jgi:HEAT repeat protein
VNADRLTAFNHPKDTRIMRMLNFASFSRGTWLWPFVLLVGAALMAAPAQADRRARINQLSEADAIALLKQADADHEQKVNACRALRRIGTAKSVPALRGLLDAKPLAGWALYALEPMPAPEAGQALRQALQKTRGELKVSVINTLAKREDKKAVAPMIRLLRDGREPVAAAAGSALATIATPDAIAALDKFRSEADTEAQRQLAGETSLKAAQTLLQRGDQRQAAAIFDTLDDAPWPRHIRHGAFRGLAHSRPDQAGEQLIAALKKPTSPFFGLAGRVVSETRGRAQTKQLAHALSDLPKAGQVRLLKALARRGDRAARPAVLNATRDTTSAVRVAATKALQQLATADDVPRLVKLLQHDHDPTAAAAGNALEALKAPGADRAIAEALPQAPATIKVRLLELLTSRFASDQSQPIVEQLHASSTEVQIAALEALARLGSGEHVPQLIDVLGRSAAGPVRDAARQAVLTLCARAGRDALDVVQKAFPQADAEVKAILLRALGQIGGDKALAQIKKATTQAATDPAVRAAGIHVLSQWPDATPAPHLLTLAKQAGSAKLRRRAWQGYINLARTVDQTGSRAAMLRRAEPLAKSDAARRQWFSAWSTVHTRQALQRVLAGLDRDAIRTEAAVAAIVIGKAIRKQHPGAVAKAMRQVLERTPKPSVRERAKRLLDQAKEASHR